MAALANGGQPGSLEKRVSGEGSAFTSMTARDFKKVFRKYINLGYVTLLSTVVDKFQHLLGLTRHKLVLLLCQSKWQVGGVCSIQSLRGPIW